MSGEVKVDFSKVARLDVAFRADVVGKKAEAVEKEESLVVDKDEQVITKAMILKKITNLDLDIKIVEEKKKVLQIFMDEFFPKK